MPKSKRLNKTEILPKGSTLTNTHSIVDTEPIQLNFRFLGRAGSYGLHAAFKEAKKKEGLFFSDLEKFLDDFYRYTDLENFISAYTSQKGSKIKKESNDYLKNLIRNFETNYPEVKMFHDKNGQLKSLIHLHLKKGGKGQAVLFGVQYENTLYILGLDPSHKFSS